MFSLGHSLGSYFLSIKKIGGLSYCVAKREIMENIYIALCPQFLVQSSKSPSKFLSD